MSTKEVIGDGRPGLIHQLDDRGLRGRLLRRIVRVLGGTTTPVNVSRVRDSAPATHGAKGFVTDVTHPLLVRVGELWAAGEISVQQEHLTSELVSTQLRALLAAYEVVDARPLVLLATLPDELHGLGIEMVALYLCLHGASVRLLGRSTPVAEIVDAAIKLQVDVVGVSVSAACDTRRASRGLASILDRLPRRVALWVGGSGAARPSIAKLRGRVIADWAELDEALAAWRRTR